MLRTELFAWSFHSDIHTVVESTKVYTRRASLRTRSVALEALLGIVTEPLEFIFGNFTHRNLVICLKVAH